MDYLTRQADIISEKARQEKIIIVGCGGIGSHTAMALARMGYHNITLIDDDVVSIHNVSSQGFDMVDVGKYKVTATKEKIMRAVRKVVKVEKRKIQKGDILEGTEATVILAVDNMAARKNIVGDMRWFLSTTIINPAMGAEYCTIDTYDCNDRDWEKEFDKAWFSDEQGVPERCTAKATIYTTLLIAGFISKIIKDKTNGLPYTKNFAYDIKNNSPVLIYDSEGKDLIG